ncbi:hypothetical protein E2C01_026156 [Portunus trituberculatus]|uniref:Uncharacterized protein n=1 Tax=Portunus trituberculatus TaxID=210409 RepID=A0A5B7EHF3_PORTR|nr:hypothetical protein [Portunus trituberculatus]
MKYSSHVRISLRHNSTSSFDRRPHGAGRTGLSQFLPRLMITPACVTKLEEQANLLSSRGGTKSSDVLWMSLASSSPFITEEA